MTKQANQPEIENAKLMVYAKVFAALAEAGYVDKARQLIAAEFKKDFPEKPLAELEKEQTV